MKFEICAAVNVSLHLCCHCVAFEEFGVAVGAALGLFLHVEVRRTYFGGA